MQDIAFMSSEEANATITFDVAGTITCYKGRPIIFDPVPRRITHEESERLQGFPTDHTAVGGPSIVDRHKAIGNSMPVNCMQWIGMGIQDAGSC